MKIKITECEECKSKEVLITSNLKGDVFAATCPECGWEWESKEFKTLASEMEDTIANFDRSEILKTKKKSLLKNLTQMDYDFRKKD